MIRTRLAALLAASLFAASARADVPRTDKRLEPEAQDGFRGEIGATSLLAVGLLPWPGAGASLSTAFRWSSVSLAVEARFVSSLDGKLDDVQVATNVAMPALTLCAHRAAFSACAIADAGELRILEDRAIRVVSQAPWESSVGLRAGGEWAFSSYVTLHGFAEIHVQLSRSSVWLNGVESWEAPPFFGVVGIGLVFPMGPL